MKKLVIAAILCLFLASCADSKRFKRADGTEFLAEPYGWTDYEEMKIKGVRYKPNIGNIILSVIFCETVIVPIWLTGWQIMEPVDYIPDDKTVPVTAPPEAPSAPR